MKYFTQLTALLMGLTTLVVAYGHKDQNMQPILLNNGTPYMISVPSTSSKINATIVAGSSAPANSKAYVNVAEYDANSSTLVKFSLTMKDESGTSRFSTITYDFMNSDTAANPTARPDTINDYQVCPLPATGQEGLLQVIIAKACR